MRFTFFAAVVAACNFITTPQASGLTQHQPQLFDEPATYFAQITASEKKDGPVKKDQTKGQPTLTVPKKPVAAEVQKKDAPVKKTPPKQEGDAKSKKEAPKAEKKQEKAPTKKEDAGPQPKTQAQRDDEKTQKKQEDKAGRKEVRKTTQADTKAKEQES